MFIMYVMTYSYQVHTIYVISNFFPRLSVKGLPSGSGVFLCTWSLLGAHGPQHASLHGYQEESNGLIAFRTTCSELSMSPKSFEPNKKLRTKQKNSRKVHLQKTHLLFSSKQFIFLSLTQFGCVVSTKNQFTSNLAKLSSSHVEGKGEAGGHPTATEPRQLLQQPEGSGGHGRGQGHQQQHPPMAQGPAGGRPKVAQSRARCCCFLLALVLFR